MDRAPSAYSLAERGCWRNDSIRTARAGREVMMPNPICVSPETLVSDAVVLMLERGFRHLPLVSGTKMFSVRDALPREIGVALGQAEFNAQVNDVLG
jgi:CBS domain-containing protein